MRFGDWLITEESSAPLFAKAVDKRGLDSILKSGLRLGDRQSTSSAEFSRGGGATEEQMYGPGLYFYMVPSEGHARKNCKEYSGWGGSVVLASPKAGAKFLVTSWLPESHPVWRSSPAGYAGVYEQLESLGVLEQFPEYKRGDTHVDPEWGYRLAGRIDGWIHQHNTRTHLVAYNPSSLEVVGHFDCVHGDEPPRVKSSSSVPGPSKTNSKTGREYDKSIPLDRQMIITGLLKNMRELNAVREIQSDPRHPDHEYWKGFRVGSDSSGRP